MALMVRNQFETDNRQRQLMLLLALVAGLAMTDELEVAANLFVAVLQGARSRSWQRGVNRVALWSFQNMYSDGRRMLGFDAVAERRHGRLGARGAFA